MTNDYDIAYRLKEIVLDKIEICMYGLGIIGENAGRIYLKHLGVTPDYYCDSNKKKVDSFTDEHAKAMYLDELLAYDRSIAVITTVGEHIEKDVTQTLSTNKKIEIITWKEICNSETLYRSFLGIDFFPKFHTKKRQLFNAPKKYCGERIAAFTCITGGYDIPIPIDIMNDFCDYYLITDDIIDVDGYSIIDVDDVIPKECVTPKDKNCYCKMHGFEIFRDYDYSIYIDGNLIITGDLRDLLGYLGDVGLAFHRHPFSYGPYGESLRMYAAGRINEKDLNNTVQWLLLHDVPSRILYVEGGVIVSDHRNKKGCQILRDWWNLFITEGMKRDQVCLGYLIYSNGLDENNIGIIPGSVVGGEYLKKKQYTLLVICICQKIFI